MSSKAYDLSDGKLKFVSRADDITLDDDPNSLRAEMSCGHAVTPQSLTGWCRSLLDQGQYRFTCPALKDGTLQKCEAIWPYEEIRRLAVLTNEEQNYFEENMALVAAAEYCEFKCCPGCQSYVERKNLANLAVKCSICTAVKGRSFNFCWQCLNTWKGPAPRTDCCENPGCTNPEVLKLLTCKELTLGQVQSVVCPSMRACPTCGRLVEHNGMFCKNILCQRCKVEFCFLCLKTKKDCSKTSQPYTECPEGVVPRQTSIPVWQK